MKLFFGLFFWDMIKASEIAPSRFYYLEREELEPPLNIEPEWMRLIRPSQIMDQSGLGSMQAMLPAKTENGEKPRHFFLALPTGLYIDSEDLFGFFTYEFRVGHHDPTSWSTAQGRYGPPFGITGVQWPPVQFICSRDLKSREAEKNKESFTQFKFRW